MMERSPSTWLKAPELKSPAHLDMRERSPRSVAEGARRLGDHAELDGAGKVERRHDEHGQDLDQVRVAHREELEVALRAFSTQPLDLTN